MSKLKKKYVRSSAPVSEIDVKFEKIIQTSGWMFLLALGGFMAIWGIFDAILNMIQLELDPMTYSFIIFTGTSAALCFALTTKIRNNREKKKQLFLDWLLGEFLFCMFAIFVIAIYQF